MATVKYNLRQKANPSPQTIYLIFRHQKEKLVYSTGFKVAAKYWSDDNQRVKNVTHVKNKDEINNYLNELKAEVMAYASIRIRERKPITKDIMKQFINKSTGKSKQDVVSFFGFVSSFIEQSAHRVNPDTGTIINYRTIQKYKTAESKLLEYQEATGKPLDFNSIDTDFYDDFVKWLQDEFAYSVNTIGKYIKTLKTFLNEATSKGVNTNLAFRSRHFKVVEEDSDSIYLNEKELSKIYKFDLSQNKRLERVRDLFIIGAWTGLRFSDWCQIKPEIIRGNFLHLTQYKTNNKVVIPMNPTVTEILEKYNNDLPSDISNQRMNDYIKEVCEIAGLKEKVQTGITKGGKRIIRTYEKWELVQTHTARRSFATNLYKSGFPAISIRKITGHRSDQSFMKYIKVTPEEHAELLQLHWNKRNGGLKIVS